MKKKLLVIASFITSFSNLAIAGCIVTPDPIITLTLGAAWPNGIHSKNLTCGCDIEKTYTEKKRTQPIGSAEIFVGWERTLNPSYRMQFGIAAAAASQITVGGDILDIPNDYEFRSSSYAYEVNHARLTGKVLFSYDTGYKNLSLYLDDSMGVGFNRARSYRITDQECWAVPGPNFASRTTKSFVNTIGIGVQMPFKTYRVAVGYEFDYLGKFELKSASGSDLTHSLYTNMVTLTLSSLR